MNKKNETLSNFIIKHLANLSSITKAWKVALPPIEKIAYKSLLIMVTRPGPVQDA